MATLASFRTAVINKIGSFSASDASDLADIDRYINEGVVRVLTDSACSVSSATVTPGANADYTLPSTVLNITEAYFTSGSYVQELVRVSPQEILDLRRNSTATSAATSFFALQGHNLVMFWPTPGASDTLTYYYVPKPTALSVSSHDTSSFTYGGLPVYAEKAVEMYACAEAADQDDDQSSSQGTRYRDLYDKEIVRVKKIMRRALTGRQARYRPANLRTRLRPHDNSADWWYR